MSFYDNQPWSPAAQPSMNPWEKPHQQTRTGTSSVTSNDSAAFASQFEEVDKAIDNMIKSGACLPGVHGLMRHDSPAMHGRHYGSYAPGPMSYRPHGEYDNMRPYGPGFNNSNDPYGNQQTQFGQDHMVQSQRRMAALRERQLRNFHQEQQYNRHSSVKPERAMSPNAANEADLTVNEAERRELLARQHRALYGKDANMFTSDNGKPVGKIGKASVDSAVQMPARDAHLAENEGRRTSVPAARINLPSFGASESAPQSGARTATASPLASPAIGSGGMPSLTTSGIGAIGSRFGQPQSAVGSKSSMTPKERSSSAASNPAAPQEKTTSFGAWGNSGVWGNSKNGLGVQASVWG